MFGQLMRGVERLVRAVAKVLERAVVVPLQHVARGLELALCAQHRAEIRDELGAHGRIHLRVAARLDDRLLDDLGDARRSCARRARLGFGERRDHEIAHRVGAPRRFARDAALPERERKRRDDAEREQRRDDDAALVARDELLRAIPGRRRMRRHRAAIEQPFDVVGERAGRDIAPLGLGRDRLQHDVVQIAAKLAARHRRRRGQHAGLVVRRDVAGRRAAGSVVEALAGDQLAEQHAEREDVGRGRDRRAGALLGRGVGRRERGHARLRLVIRVEQLGDAEVEQLDLAVGGDEHVGRLEVAMHDQRAMRGFDRAADLQEQLQSRAQIEPAVACIVGDRYAFDQVERNVGEARFADAALDQPRDARMAKLREREPLAAELALGILRIEAAPEQLQRDHLAHAIDRALGAEHGRGAAFAEDFEQLERADARAWREALGRIGLANRARDRVDAAVEHDVVVGVGRDHALDLRAKIRIGAAARIEEGGARGGREREGFLEKVAQRVAAGRHGGRRRDGSNGKRRPAPSCDTARRGFSRFRS